LKSGEDKRQKGSRVTRGELFSIFLKAGLAFGGGLGILAVLERELVTSVGLILAAVVQIRTAKGLADFWQTLKNCFTQDSQLMWSLDYPSAIQGG